MFSFSRYGLKASSTGCPPLRTSTQRHFFLPSPVKSASGPQYTEKHTILPCPTGVSSVRLMPATWGVHRNENGVGVSREGGSRH